MVGGASELFVDSGLLSRCAEGIEVGLKRQKLVLIVQELKANINPGVMRLQGLVTAAYLFYTCIL
jgi:hypothetical protein